MRQILILASILSVYSSCYEMQEDERGRMIRLNRRTGEVAIVGEDTLQILKDADEVEAEGTALRGPRSWPPQKN